MNLYIPKIKDKIQSVFDKLLINKRNDVYKDYYSTIDNYLISGGKRIRPLLCIATYNAFSEEKDDKILGPSVGAEFFHNASLIHDDIIDNDNVRRGRPSLHYEIKLNYLKLISKKDLAEKYGSKVAVMSGITTAFLGLSTLFDNEFENELNLKAIDYAIETCRQVLDGVLLEIEFINQNNLKTQDYIKMVSLKTGAFIEKSMLIGATYAKADEKYNQFISKYGINLGINFQIIDDILGTFGDEKVTGKPTDGDIREGKKTCLLIEAYNNLEEKKREQLDKLIKKPNISKHEVQEIRELFIEADVLNSCKDLVNHHTNEAKTALERLEGIINDDEAEFFEDLLNFIVKRKY